MLGPVAHPLPRPASFYFGGTTDQAVRLPTSRVVHFCRALWARGWVSERFSEFAFLDTRAQSMPVCPLVHSQILLSVGPNPPKGGWRRTPRVRTYARRLVDPSNERT